MTSTNNEAPSRKIIPQSRTISVLPTNTARVYTNIHPVLVLSLYYIFFPSLVADPVSTLKKALAPLAHLQIIYCVVCLPPFAGSPSPKAEATKTPKRKKVQFAHTAKGPSTKPATIASRLVVCYLVPSTAISPLQLALTLYVSSLARNILPCPRTLTLSTLAHRYDNLIRRFYKYVSMAHPPLRHTHVYPWCSAFILHPWRRCKDVERDSGRLSSF